MPKRSPLSRLGGKGADPKPSRPQQERIKITLGIYQSDMLAMAEQYSMNNAQFCAYCVKYFIDYFDGRSLPPLKKVKQPSLDL